MKSSVLSFHKFTSNSAYKYHLVGAHLGRNAGSDELDLVLSHVIADHLGHLLVEASQEYRANHDGDVEPETGEESSALERHVRRSNDERLAGTVGQREQVVAGNRGKTTNHHLTAIYIQVEML